MMGARIELSDEHAEMVRRYATAAMPNHKHFGRSDDKVWADIRVGKGGEVAYCLLHGIPLSELSFDPAVTVDPGYDLVRDGLRIDVKTVRTPNDRVRFNPDYANCDRYAVMRCGPSDREYEYVLSIDKCLALRHARFENGIWFMDLGADLDSLRHCGYIADA